MISLISLDDASIHDSLFSNVSWTTYNSDFFSSSSIDSSIDSTRALVRRKRDFELKPIFSLFSTDDRLGKELFKKSKEE
jgi:hypothetical protein